MRRQATTLASLLIVALLPTLYLWRALFRVEAAVLARDVVLALLVGLLLIGSRCRVRVRNRLAFFLLVAWGTLVLGGMLVSVVRSVPVGGAHLLRLGRIYLLSIAFYFLADMLGVPWVCSVRRWLTFAGIVVLVYAAKQDVLGFAPFEMNYIGSGSMGGFSARDPKYFAHAFSTLGSPNVLAAFALMVFWLVIAGSRCNPVSRLGFLHVGAGVWALYGLVAARMKISLVALAASALTYALLVWGKRGLRAALGVVALAAVGLASVGRGVLSLVGKAFRFNQLSGSVLVRMNNLAEIVGRGLSPLGGGVGSTASLARTPDSTYLSILAQFGWIGLLAFGALLLIVGVWPSVWRAITSTGLEERRYWSASAAFLVGCLVMGATSEVLVNSVMGAYFWFIAGEAVARMAPEEHEVA